MDEVNVIELQNKVIEQANISFDRVSNLLFVTISIFLTIAGILAVLQYKMSDNQIKKLKVDIKNELIKDYGLDKIPTLESDIRYSYMIKYLDTMNDNIRNEFYSISLFNFSNALKYIDCHDERFVESFILNGHSLLYISALSKDGNLATRNAPSYDNQWNLKLKIIEDYRKVLDKLEEHGISKVSFKSLNEYQDDVRLIINGLHKQIEGEGLLKEIERLRKNAEDNTTVTH